MPITVLSQGYQKPSDPTAGDLWFAAMEENIQLMNDHTHAGDDGAFIAKSTSSVVAGSWGADLGGGLYRQLITLPDSRTFDTTKLEVRRSTGEVVYAQIERVSATTFYIYTNDNSLDYTIYYV